jgi:uncharacterized protein (TIGR02646 family)
MMYMNRADHEQPQIWKENWERWTKAYLNNLEENPRHQLNMQNSEPKKKAYEKLVDILLTITKQHCAFCDNSPLGNRNIKPTIEHFRPKSRAKYPELAYKWDNLFPSCSYCQEKNDDFDEKLLKPDIEGYDFNNYFVFDDKEWEIKPTTRQDISDTDKKRAEITIEMYNLNGKEDDKGNLLKDVRIERQRIMNLYLTTKDPIIDDFAFRFMFY